MDHGEKAEELFLRGYNCSQAVFAAFCDRTGLGEEEAARIASSLGGGVGRLREMCGALLGAELALGMLRGYGTPETGRLKAELYERVQALAHSFREENGSYICRELLGLEGESVPVPAPRDAAFYAARPCLRLVRSAAALLERLLNGEPLP